MNGELEDMMSRRGVRPTSNRVMILRQIINSTAPLSLSDLENSLETLDKSSIFRVLMTLANAGILHSIEDGRGVTHYEICRSNHDSDSDDDSHIHFFCRECKELICLEDLPLPQVNLPYGFDIEGGNYMLKGVCPKCSNKR